MRPYDLGGLMMESTDIVVITVSVITLVIVVWAAWLSYQTGKVLEDVRLLMIGAQIHSVGLGHSIDQLTGYTMRAGPATFGTLPFTSYDQYVQEAAKKLGVSVDV